MKFKICLILFISQLIAKILLKQRSLNQISHCFTGYNEIWHHLLSKNIVLVF